MNAPDLLSVARSCIAASTTTQDEAVAVYYLAAARGAIVQAKEELRTLAALVSAREAELARRSAPKAQEALAIEGGG
jgi:hypothetical protein